MRLLKLVFVLSFFFTSSVLIFAQDPPPIKWGEIPRTDLEMKTFPKDTNASAIILCDYGETGLNNDLELVFTRCTRIKILTTKGYELGTQSIDIYSEKSTEQIDDIEAVTYTLNSNGEIEKKELDDDDIFEEKINDRYTRYKFTLPGLQPGCVIEYRYKITATNLFFIRDWVFQWNEPVRWSEYRVTCPRNIAYTVLRLGYEPFVINEMNEVTGIFNGSAQAALGGDMVKCYQIKLAVQDAPALREEPFISTLNDYRNEVQLQLAEYSFTYSGRQKVLQDWPAFIKELIDHDDFYEKIDDTKDVTKLAEKVTAGCKSDEEKIKAIYNWISKSIVWSGENRMFAEKDVDDVIETKKGNSADITFLLLSMLKSIGIKGDPVILSTRNHGKIQDLYPMTSQFNYVITRIKIGSLNLFIDATDPNRPIDLIPVKVINAKGLVIQESDKPEWVTISTTKKELKKSLTEVELNDNGLIKAYFDDSYFDYAAVILRDDIQGKKEEEIARDIFDTDNYGFTVDSIKINDADSINKPLNIQCWITSENYATNNADMIYLNPYLIHRMDKNPLKAEIRHFPVDYGLLASYQNFIKINLPEGYEIKENVKNKNLTVGSGVSFKRQCDTSGSKIVISNKYDVNEYIIKPLNYDKVKNFYSQLVAAESEQIVIQKRSNIISDTVNKTEGK